jgi:hypothetical protein
MGACSASHGHPFAHRVARLILRINMNEETRVAQSETGIRKAPPESSLEFLDLTRFLHANRIPLRSKTLQSMIPKSGNRFSEKIMLKQKR